MNTKTPIDTAYEALERVCDGIPGNTASRLLTRLTETALRQEKQHRHGRGRARKPASLAARYWAVRCTYAAPVLTLVELASLREDYQIGALLGAYLRKHAFLPSLPTGFEEIDYAKDLT